MSPYDLQRRIEVLVEEYLDNKIADRICLDMGCGTGHFSSALNNYKPKQLTSVDISPQLVLITKRKLPAANCINDNLENFCRNNQQSFEIIICSEVIEHTKSPLASIESLSMTLSPGGFLSLSCPNYFWKWLLHLANLLGIREHYKGYENWITPFQMINSLEKAGLNILKKNGIHTVPWQFLPKPVLKWLDKVSSRYNFYFALNLAVLAQKPKKHDKLDVA